MRYRNLITQAVIETACKISGGNWVEVEVEQPKKTASTTVTPKTEVKSTTKSPDKKATKKKTSGSKTTAKTTRKKSGE